jgi:hypothetical protein
MLLSGAKSCVRFRHKISLLFPLTNSVCRSSCCCCRTFSFLFDCVFASRGFTNIRRRMILRKTPALVKPADIIMTSRHQTCRTNSFGRAAAERFSPNEVNVSRIVLIIRYLMRNEFRGINKLLFLLIFTAYFFIIFHEILLLDFSLHCLFF